MTSGQIFYQFMNDQQPSNSLLDQLNCQEEEKMYSSQLNMQKNCEEISLPINTQKSKKQKAIANRARKQKIQEKSNNPNIKLGHWGLEENKKYHWFLELYNSHFMNKHMRRMDKIFKTMANFVGSREAQQCRSHHQKMQKKYHSFSKILISLRKQHYNTKETAQIEADMLGNNVEITVQLLAGIQLEEQLCTAPNSPSEHTIKSENQTEQMNQLLFEEENDPIANLLSDENYQNNLNFICFF